MERKTLPCVWNLMHVLQMRQFLLILNSKLNSSFCDISYLAPIRIVLPGQTASVSRLKLLDVLKLFVFPAVCLGLAVNRQVYLSVFSQTEHDCI